MEKIKLANEGRYNELATTKKGARDGKGKNSSMNKSNNSNFYNYSSPDYAKERNQRFLNTEGTEQTSTQYQKTKPSGNSPSDENIDI